MTTKRSLAMIEELHWHLGLVNVCTRWVFGKINSFSTFRDSEHNKCIEMSLPVLVEATTALLRQMLSPDIDGSTLTEWSFDITDGSDHNHWWSFENGDCLDDFLLIDLC